jgi:hypothetical protein
VLSVHFVVNICHKKHKIHKKNQEKSPGTNTRNGSVIPPIAIAFDLEAAKATCFSDLEPAIEVK